LYSFYSFYSTNRISLFPYIRKKIIMGKFFDAIQPSHTGFIQKQQMFFVATAPLSGNGRVNLSPKGLDAFRVLDEHTVGYMDLISSGNETSAHTRENGRITLMFCSFGEKPMILRLYGKGWAVMPGTADWELYSPHFTIYPSTRQLILSHIDLVQTSCGFGVPMYEFTGNRQVHFDWAEGKGDDGLQKYMQEKNRISIDGLITDFGAAMAG
jgi:hypothetical protein